MTKRKRPKIIAIFNCKGGVGKTTIAIILTQIALINKEKVLAIEQDEQCNFLASISYMKKDPNYKDLITAKADLKQQYSNNEVD